LNGDNNGFLLWHMKSTSLNWYVYRTRRCGSFICVFWMRAYP